MSFFLQGTILQGPVKVHLCAIYVDTPAATTNRGCSIIMRLSTPRVLATSALVVKKSVQPEMPCLFTNQEPTDFQKYNLLCRVLGLKGLSQDVVLECLVGRKMQRSLTGDWLCLECGLINKIKQRVIQHIESKHLDIGTICEICKKCCSTRNALRVHKYRHHKPESS